ncbi:MAG: C40 family peptidase, partial [Bacilli bacterium]|nr:C40 family peptidase [Bacilli bacterium]
NNKECILELKIATDYDLTVEDALSTSQKYNILDFLNNNLAFEFQKETIYLIPGEEKEIEYITKNITTKPNSYTFKSKNEQVATINNNIITGISPGTTEIYLDDKASLKVIVTNLITKPTLPTQKKEVIACQKYNENEAKILDELLEARISDAGYKTRAGAVAAARFLTLEFPYRIPYFYENGRLHSSGVNYVDGEGRYYKKGLYLHKNKYSGIKARFSGPAMWGCALTNWEDNEDYGYKFGTTKPNGLDCSGFVSWALLNGGFDPGDIGAGESPYPYQMTDLGKYTRLTSDLINSDKIKVGDLFNYWGHIAILIGMDKDNFYIAESLPHLGGVVAKKYSKKNVTSTFDYVVLMDEYYKKDGNYTEYWN